MHETKDILRTLLTGQSLSEQQAEEVFHRVLSGGMDDAQIGSLLTSISARPGGPTVDELVGGARVMRQFVTRVPVPDNGRTLIDTCGTGGAPKTFNVSTVAGFVVAAAKPTSGPAVMVAKHGSLSRTGRGSAEVLQKLGVNVAAAAEVQTRCLAELGICFCFAIHHHPAMKHAAGPRKSLGFPTIFNLLGPLTNPAGALRQLLGTYSPELALKLARTLARLGVERALVVTSQDGLDELTTTDRNITHSVCDGHVTTRELDALQHGLSRATLGQLQVKSLDEAAQILSSVLAGRRGSARDIVLLNAAAALVTADAATTFDEGLGLAAESIDSGRAALTLGRLIEITNGRA